MTGTYDRGSIVYDRPVPVSSLKVGDPITYDPPSGFTDRGLQARDPPHHLDWASRERCARPYHLGVRQGNPFRSATSRRAPLDPCRG